LLCQLTDLGCFVTTGLLLLQGFDDIQAATRH